MEKRGQVATEYLILVGIVLLIMIPAFIFYSLSTTESQQISRQTQAEQTTKKLVDTAENVYFLGEGTTTTVKARVPGGVKEIRIEQEEFIMGLTGPQGQPYDVAKLASVPISYGVYPGTNNPVPFPTDEGTYNFIIVSMGGHVCITLDEGICPGTPPNPPPTPRRSCSNVGGECMPSGNCGGSDTNEGTLDCGAGRTCCTCGPGKTYNSAKQECEGETPNPPLVPGDPIGITVCKDTSNENTAYCGESDGICPIEFGTGWASEHIIRCCGTDSDCDSRPICS